MGTLRQHFEVEQPLAAVYDALSHPSSILQDLPGISSIGRTSGDVYRVTLTIAGAAREIDFEITAREPMRRIEWRGGNGAWLGAIELAPMAPDRTAVTIDAQSAAGREAEWPPATALHEGVQALKRALQAPRAQMNAASGVGAGARELAAEWRDTARSAISRPLELPLTVMRTLTRQVDRFWGDVWRGSPMERLPQMVPGFPRHPDVDVSEEEGEICVRVDVPGCDESNLEVDVDERMLTVRGERHDDRGGVGQRRSEVHYGRFTRRIPLSVSVDPDTARATLSKGVLEIRLQTQRKPPRRVPVEQRP